jgi:hypothetical protein
MDIELIIREKINMPSSDDLSIYKMKDLREKYHSDIANIVNEYVPRIDNPVNEKILRDLRETGYSVVENFLSPEEVKNIVEFTSNIKGYKFHTPNRAYDKTPKKFDKDLDWNVCAYKMNHLMHNSQILNMITRPDIVATIQEYIGCLPTITSVSAWWSKYTGETFHTQNVHRDYDDFKFVAFFIYLTDTDENTGPHVYYSKTHNGSDDMSDKKIVTGKAGTAIFGDTYALHHGNPLNEGQRLLFWTRYCLHKNNNFYRDQCQEYVQEANMFFDIIEDNEINRHLLHAFIR